MTRELGMTSGAADTQSSIWNGVCYLTPLLGGWYVSSCYTRCNGSAVQC
jgi:dipeptide/tripeptide permease